MSESVAVGWYRGGRPAALVARVGAVAALTGSAAVHATVIGDHLDEWPPAGWFFVIITIAELLLALAVTVGWSRPTAIAVVLVSTGTVLVWLVSRTVGLPFGPAELRAVETVGAPDLACCVLEVAAAALVAPWALRRWSRRRTAPVVWDRAGIAAATVLAGVLSAVGLWGLVSSLNDAGPAEHGSMSSPSHSVAHPGRAPAAVAPGLCRRTPPIEKRPLTVDDVRERPSQVRGRCEAPTRRPSGRAGSAETAR
jgi:hypothetical protein